MRIAVTEGLVQVPPFRYGVRRSFSVKSAIARVTRAAREHGQKSASIRDWHAMRTTFVTLALSAGVPLELVKRVTGHATVEVVLKHYFRPDREQFRAALTRIFHTPELKEAISTPMAHPCLGAERLRRSDGMPQAFRSRKAAEQAPAQTNLHSLSTGCEICGLTGALPDVLTGGTPAKVKPADELVALSAKLAAGSATVEDKARFRKLAAKV